MAALGFLGALLSSCAAPLINDVSTDLDNPPAFTHAPTLPANQGRDFTYPPDFVPKVREAYPQLQPLLLPLSSRDAFDLALDTARAMPNWDITHVKEDDMTFEGIATTRLLRFKDDFVVRIQKADPEEIPESERGFFGFGAKPHARVDMRSKSRLGKGDLGANAKRIRYYLETLHLRVRARQSRDEQ